MDRDFFIALHHELKSALSAIVGFSAVILDGIDGPLTDDQEEDITSIRDAGEETWQRLSRFLDLLKIEQGLMDLTIKPIDLAPVISTVIAAAEARCADRPIQLRAELATDAPPALGDYDLTRDILTELVTNACQYTERGVITISTQSVVENQRKMVQVSVRDTGVGIAAQDLPGLFDAFRAKSIIYPKPTTSYGVGLALAHGWITAQGGRMWVESAPGVGSTFHFTLPGELAE